MWVIRPRRAEPHPITGRRDGWSCTREAFGRLLLPEAIPMESLEILFLVYLLALGLLGWLYWMVNEFS